MKRIALTVLSLSLLAILGGCNQAPTSQDAYSTSPTPPVTMTPPASPTPTETPATTDQTQTSPTDTTMKTTTPSTQDSQLTPPKEGDQIAIIETDLGTIKMKLFTKDVPELTKNFVTLAKDGKYNNVPFHRVIKDFMIQTGDFTEKNGTGGYSYKGPGTQLPNEIVPTLHHLYGTVSMAKTMAPVSIGSQFFIVTNKKGTAFLDGSYSPIGQVYEGMDVAEKIQNLQVAGSEQPSKVVNMKKVTISTFTSAKTKSTK